MYVQVLYHINTFDDKVDLYLKKKNKMCAKSLLIFGFQSKVELG